MVDGALVVVGGDLLPREIPLTRLPLIVGRAVSSDLVLASPLVSRRHCVLEEVNGQLVVRDLGSRNGTFVGRDRVHQASPLPPGGLLTIGTITFRAVYAGYGLPRASVSDDTALAHGPHSDTVSPHAPIRSPISKVPPDRESPEELGARRASPLDSA